MGVWGIEGFPICAVTQGSGPVPPVIFKWTIWHSRKVTPRIQNKL